MWLIGTNAEDTAQVIVGASAIAVPICFTEEAWQLAGELSRWHLGPIVAVTLGYCLFYAHFGIYRGQSENRRGRLVARALLTYALALAVVAAHLAAFNRLPLIEEPELALKRLALIAYPAAMGAVMVDGLDKE